MKLSEVTFTDAELALIHRLATRGDFRKSDLADKVLPALRDFLAGDEGATLSKREARRKKDDFLIIVRTGAPVYWDMFRVETAVLHSAKAVFAARTPAKLKCFLGARDGREVLVAAPDATSAAYALDMGTGHFGLGFKRLAKRNLVATAKPFTAFARTLEGFVEIVP